MGYIAWRKENEAKYRDIVNDGALETFPGFKESAYNELSSTLIAPIVEQILDDPDMTPIHFASVFAEYLYEEYHVIPADLEVLVQYFSLAFIKHTKVVSEQTAQMILKDLQQYNEEESEEDENDK